MQPSNERKESEMLLPCPFCGSTRVGFGLPFGDNEINVAVCDGCGAEGPTLHGNDSISETEAAALWNKRLEIHNAK